MASDQDGKDAEHTLLLVEEDVLDDPDLYQVAKVEHPPDSKQAEAVEEAMRQLVDEAEAETGTRHRFVKESSSPEMIRMNYESHVDPLSIKGRAFEDKILWRRHAQEPAPKLVEVKQCLRDDSDGHWEYVLTDMTHTTEHRYHEDDLADCFWDTGLYNDEQPKGVMDDRIRDVFQRVCEHSFYTVHDPETHEPAGEQCIHCRKRRGEE